MAKRLPRGTPKWSTKMYVTVAERAVAHFKSMGFTPSTDVNDAIDQITECRYAGVDHIVIASVESTGPIHGTSLSGPLFIAEYALYGAGSVASGAFVAGEWYDKDGTRIKQWAHSSNVRNWEEQAEPVTASKT